MQYLLELIIFLIVLFLYIHVNYHIRTSSDPEIYEYNDTSKDKLEDMCDLKQPVIINRDILNLNIENLPINNMYKEYDILIRDIEEEGLDKLLHLPLNYENSEKLFKNDDNGQYITEQNENFIKETGLIKIIQNKDNFFRPPLYSNCFYDILMGSNNSHTPLRYEINYRNYIYVSSGMCKIKLIAPDNIQNLYPIMDYVNFEFRSSINPWKVQKEFVNEFRRIKVIDIELQQGQTLFIPAYWFYSIKFNTKTKLITMKYRNYFNIVSILSYLGMHYLQIQNIKKDKYNKFKVKISNDEIKNETTDVINVETNEEENIELEIKEKEA